jgi:uncharacterized membrane protein YGL010W
MMGGKSWDDWIDEYSESHQNKINQITHKIGIPLISLSILTIPLVMVFDGFWTISLVMFLTGWLLQFIGHYFEGKPPEFLRDYRFLFVGLRWWIKKTFS